MEAGEQNGGVGPGGRVGVPGVDGGAGVPYGQKVTGRGTAPAVSGVPGVVSGARRMPDSAGAEARARRAARASRSMSAACALATTGPLRTTVPSGRSARSWGGRQVQGVSGGWWRRRRWARVPSSRMTDSREDSREAGSPEAGSGVGGSRSTEVEVIRNGSPAAVGPGPATGPC
ncbi:hypothetical protein STAN_0945 [Streptomyces sp. CBMAI 2042]|nr:hypothetical protein STAN_0945 [Streptomyces sp. CBMAI 2042]